MSTSWPKGMHSEAVFPALLCGVWARPLVFSVIVVEYLNWSLVSGGLVDADGWGGGGEAVGRRNEAGAGDRTNRGMASWPAAPTPLSQKRYKKLGTAINLLQIGA